MNKRMELNAQGIRETLPPEYSDNGKYAEELEKLFRTFTCESTRIPKTNEESEETTNSQQEGEIEELQCAEEEAAVSTVWLERMVCDIYI